MIEDLIARLKQATGPDLDLDHAIATVVRPSDGHGVLLYTASIDAALTLVPEGLYWMTGFGRVREAEPLGGMAIFEPGETEVTFSEAEGATVPLAICIAALKARKSTLTSADRGPA